MKIFDIFSKRQQKLRGEVNDVLAYDKIPDELRVQIVYILKDGLGHDADFSYHVKVKEAYVFIVNSLCREYGVFSLASGKDYGSRNYFIELINFILNEKNVERVLDAVELSCQLIDGFTRDWNYKHSNDANGDADSALDELNARFMHHGVGYRFESGKIIRVDSEVVHAEIIKPALALLHEQKYKGAEAEYRLAHEHYRHGRTKEALAECLKALESTIKSIATQRKWSFNSSATAKTLIDLMFEKKMIPELWSSHFSGLRSMLESGVPTVRNRLGGHGQGTELVNVPSHYVAYALHQTAAAIVFLAKSNQEFK